MCGLMYTNGTLSCQLRLTGQLSLTLCTPSDPATEDNHPCPEMLSSRVRDPGLQQSQVRCLGPRGVGSCACIGVLWTPLLRLTHIMTVDLKSTSPHYQGRATFFSMEDQTAVPHGRPARTIWWFETGWLNALGRLIGAPRHAA